MSGDDLPPGFALVTPPSGGSNDLPPGFVAGAPKDDFQFTRDTFTGRLLNSIYSAVTLPGDVMAGRAHVPGSADAQAIPGAVPFGSEDSSGERIGDLATLGSPLSPAARIGVGWAGALKKVDAPVPAPTQEALESAATAGYDKARGLGVEIHPDAVSQLGDKIGASLNEMGINGELAPKTFGILNRIKSPPADSVVTVSNLETLRRALGHAAGDFANPTEQLAAKRAQGHLADYMASVPAEDVIRGPASEVSGIIKAANGNYAAAKRSDLLADELGKADQNAGAANSGANLGNAQRTKLKQIYQNDRKSAGFSDAELAQVDNIIRGSKLANTTRAAGNFLGGGGGMGALHSSSVGAGAGAFLGGPLGAAVGAVVPPTVGYGLKKWSDAIGQKQIQSLQEMIRKRSPLADSMPSTLPLPGSLSPKDAFMARLIAGGLKPALPSAPSESASEKFKRELMLRSALAAQSAKRP